jgi:hypothetical protein
MTRSGFERGNQTQRLARILVLKSGFASFRRTEPRQSRPIMESIAAVASDRHQSLNESRRCCFVVMASNVLTISDSDRCSTKPESVIALLTLHSVEENLHRKLLCRLGPFGIGYRRRRRGANHAERP